MTPQQRAPAEAAQLAAAADMPVEGGDVDMLSEGEEADPWEQAPPGDALAAAMLQLEEANKLAAEQAAEIAAMKTKLEASQRMAANAPDDWRSRSVARPLRRSAPTPLSPTRSGSAGPTLPGRFCWVSRCLT